MNAIREQIIAIIVNTILKDQIVSDAKEVIMEMQLMEGKIAVGPVHVLTYSHQTSECSMFFNK